MKGLMSFAAVLGAAMGVASSAVAFEIDTLKPFRVQRPIPPELMTGWRGFDSAPSITATRGGRLWIAWCAGGNEGGDDSGILVATSGDGGKTWTAPVFGMSEPGPMRGLEPGLWTDPDGQVWLFYGQVLGKWDGRGGVWVMNPGNPEDPYSEWSRPRRICDGFLKNKPIVRRDGAWLYAVEFMFGDEKVRTDPKYEGANVFATFDKGKTVNFLGHAEIPPKDRDAVENMVVERRDGTLWQLVRTAYGIGEAESKDGGRTWSEVKPSGLRAPNSRFFLGRLRSGALLLVKNGREACGAPLKKPYEINRDMLTAFVSDDDGRTWKGGLVIDRRTDVSYPDAVETPDGFIHVVNDWERTKAREIVHHLFTEADVRAGRLVTKGSRLLDYVTAARFTQPVPMPDYSITADFPGGNVVIDGIRGDDVYVRPDVRNSWGECSARQWAFRVKGAAGRKLSFHFPHDPIFGYLTTRGPAVSHDDGLNWKWMTDGKVENPPYGFDYTFDRNENDVLFAWQPLYTGRQLKLFVDSLGELRSRIRVETLCKTENGRDAELLRFGTDEPGKAGVFLSARHHANEISSHILEGLVREALSDSETGKCLRENASFFVVPFVDKDGVEEGKPGKSQRPHDHNRDYVIGRYATVRAIREQVAKWGADKNRLVGFDFHASSLEVRGIHLNDPKAWNHDHLYLISAEPTRTDFFHTRFGERLRRFHGPNEFIYYPGRDDGAEKGPNGNLGKCSYWMRNEMRMDYFATPESPFARADGRPNEPKDSRALGKHFAQALAVFLREDLKPIPRETPGDCYAKEIPRNLKLVWSDEFDGAELDPSKWLFERGFVRNNEPQRYTDSTNNVRVADGKLVIEAQRGKGPGEKSVEYTSGSVQTKGRFAFRYGRVDVRAKLPGGRSAWPAIWTMGAEKEWPACGEIDIMEYWGNQPGDPQGCFHWKSANADKANRHVSSGAFHCSGRNPTDHFHLYTMEWTPDRVVLRYDGEKYADFDISKADLPDGSNAFREPHYLLLNLALLPGKTKSERDLLAGDSFPQRFEIDYVRVYAEDKNCGIRVSPREVFVNHQANGRSGHMGHALVDCGGGRILDFYSNCDGKRVGGHSGYGWMEYRVSSDYGHTFGPSRVLAYSKKVYDEGRHTALCEKAIKAPDGRILLFFQITDASKPISCEPWSAPTMAVSTDNGETFSDGVEVGIDPGRIYDVKSDGRDVFVLMQSNDASVSFLGNRPEHCYKLYRMGKDGKFVPQTLPIDAKGKGYGALCFAPDGAFFVYAYGLAHETELEYIVSRDSGRTWSEPSRTRCAKKIRNPQVSRIGDIWVLVGRNGGEGDGIVLYQSSDGVTWDEGRLLDYRPTKTGAGYYSNLLPICEPGCAPRFLLQYSHVYDGNRVNIAHRILTCVRGAESK